MEFYADAVRQMHQMCSEAQLRGLSMSVLQQYLQMLEHYFNTFVEAHEASMRKAPPGPGQAGTSVELHLLRIELRDRINAQIERLVAESEGVAPPSVNNAEQARISAVELSARLSCKVCTTRAHERRHRTTGQIPMLAKCIARASCDSGRPVGGLRRAVRERMAVAIRILR